MTIPVTRQPTITWATPSSARATPWKRCPISSTRCESIRSTETLTTTSGVPTQCAASGPGPSSTYRKVVGLQPDWAPALSELAWLLATAPEERLHDAKLAVRLAEHAADITGNKDAQTLDRLAAAYADAGAFDRALATAEAALRLTRDEPLASEIRRRHALYQAHQVYRIGP